MSEDGEILNSNVSVTCNTRKSRDKTCRRHTVGVFVGKEEFKTVTEAKEHKKEHTYCKICHKDFHFPSKLTKHVNSVHTTK